MTWIGLDVHARSVEASVVDAASGELSRRRVASGEVERLVEWLGSFAGRCGPATRQGRLATGLGWM